MKINLPVRFKNKAFWAAAIPAFLLLIQVILVPFGYKFDITGINKELLDILNALFAFLALFGVVNDPTTNGVSDSKQALDYRLPKKEMKK